jgi:methionine-rich copper-binding protein CopC
MNRPVRDLLLASFAVVALVAATAATARAAAPSAEPYAPPMGLVSSMPRTGDEIDGRMVAITLRFDAPVDHARSKLTLLGSGGESRALAPRLGASPNVLYGTAGRLSSGHYRVEFQVRSPNGRLANGDVSFVVK